MSPPRRGRSAVAGVHADWLRLVEPNGPFLTLPVLRRVWPNGPDHLDADARAEVRRHLDDLDLDDPASVTAWVEWILAEVLSYGRRLQSGPQVPATLTHVAAEHGAVLRPDHVLDDGSGRARLLVTVHPATSRLEARPVGDRWAASPVERLSLLCRATGVELGLATNAMSWVLVWAPKEGASGTATFSADLFSEEPVLLDAFTSVLGARRFFAVAEADQLEALLTESAAAQAEVTGKLGQQVRQAVELLVAAMSRADRDRDGALLADVEAHHVYESAVAVLMRLVLLLYAEERGLLPLGDNLYDRTLAASTLLDQVREVQADTGDEPLERSHTAWHRLLALFRAVHAGIDHDRLRIPAYGGGLFDPDRFPFLEGRRPGERWHETPAEPLPVDDLTVLAMLAALQELRFSEGGVTETRRLTYRSLDVEQVGHVYEGLLDHSAVAVTSTALGLMGKAGNEPEIALDDVTRHAARGRDALVGWLVEVTGLTAKRIERLLDAEADADTTRLLRAACENDEGLAARITPYVHLLRRDLRGLPTVFAAGSMYVTQTGAKRDSGTAYTTKELADEVVEHALAPLVYSPGPAEGADPADWQLRSSTGLLDLKVCDPAVGSGAILVAACRYLADRLVEAWTTEGAPEADGDPDEVVITARRAVADRCLYGVDRDPMAVEMAKLSLWLVTLSKERPFTFLDHAIKAGDSLLGITDLDQLQALHLDPAVGRAKVGLSLKPDAVDEAVARAIHLRRRLELIPVVTVADADLKARLNTDAIGQLAALHTVADLVVGSALRAELVGHPPLEDQVAASVNLIAAALDGDGSVELREAALEQIASRAQQALHIGRPHSASHRRPLHWPLAFPEVFVDDDRRGFDAFVGNPPYMGNKYWKERLGGDMQPLYARLMGGRLGKPDLIVVFLWRISQLLRPGGLIGSLTTQSITEVDSKLLMQRTVLADCSIYRAISSRRWPGTAAVTVSVLWMHRGAWSGHRNLDGVAVDSIAADLTASEDLEPYELKSLLTFEGVHNARGLAFVVDRANPLTRFNVFRPYVSGEDLTQCDPRHPNRVVLDLTGWTADALDELPLEVRTFLHDVVAPTRSSVDLRSYKGLSDRWWTFWNTREEGFQAVRRRDHLIAIPAVAKYTISVRMPAAWLYTNKVIVVDESRPDLHVLLLSQCFDLWAEKYGGTMGEGRVMKVGPVVRTFPCPTARASAGLADDWKAAVMDALDDFGPGLTGVFNAVHDPACAGPKVTFVRDCLARIHAESLRAFGWSDLSGELHHVILREGVRWSISTADRLHLHSRLLRLNRQRYAEEVAVGLHDKKKSRGRRKKTSPEARTLL
jgi:hypothetical protein